MTQYVSCKKGWLVGAINNGYPSRSEYEFHLHYVCNDERVTTVEDVDQGRAEKVGQRIIQTIKYTRMSEIAFELRTSLCTVCAVIIIHILVSAQCQAGLGS